MKINNRLEKCQLCVCLGESKISDLLEQLKRAGKWADLIEIRLDKFERLDKEIIQKIESHSPCPLIWTLRKSSQGGLFQGTEEEHSQLLKSLLNPLTSSYIDLEADTSETIIQSLKDFFPHAKWIISWHDTKTTPHDLDSLYRFVTKHHADFYKIVTTAQLTTDALRMLNFIQKHNQLKKKICGLCMGERGQSTRILGSIMGSPITYASLEKGKETAPGQITAGDLVDIYRFREMTPDSQFLGLIGRPVDKSFSHLSHNAVLRKLSLNGVYLKFHLEDHEFDDFFKEIQTLPVRGLSVTMPFKEKVLSLLTYPHQLAACNTLKKTPQGWEGLNTDGIGSLKALNFSSLKGQKMVILGAGGTAKAIVQAAHQQGADLAVLNRTIERAKHIAQPVNAKWGSLDQLKNLMLDGYKCVIQATSVGMAPAIDETPVPSEWISSDSCILDVVSNPPETRLLREMKSKGARTISGRELFIHQAVEQFVCWFGNQTNQDQIEETIRQNLPKIKKVKSVEVLKSQLHGNVTLPSSKSHTIRAILLAAMTKGTSHIHHPLNSPDSQCAIQAAMQFGAQVNPTSTGLSITGVAGNPRTPHEIIDVGNSGQVLRFAGALAALSEGYTVFTGDESVRTNRPIQPLIDGLNGLNGWAVSTRQNGFAPLIVKGPIQAGYTQLEGQDSQPVSALLIASAFVNGQTTIEVRHAGEKPWLALTLSWLDRLGVNYQHRDFEFFTVNGQRIRPAFEVSIPGDLSALAFPMAAALITQSEIMINRVDVQDIQGDKELIYLLQRMGASLEILPDQKQLKIHRQGKLKGQMIDVNDFIDAVPILAVLGCYASGETRLINASIARNKESNRLACITSELKKMGADIEETFDGLRVKKSKLKGASVNSHGDHRLAMSLIIAGLGAEGKTQVQGIECISKSYPHFIADFIHLGAILREDQS